MNAAAARLGWALWMSEDWAREAADRRAPRGVRLYCRARAAVLFDRTLNGEVTRLLRGNPTMQAQMEIANGQGN